jgi:aspartyl-tRNA(Asn)/glutamyl-tRNA(Gln) amidotransferase subunit C
VTISAAEVEHVAMLARLNIPEEDLEAYTRQMGDILKWIQKLEELDTKELEPTAHVLPVHNVFREDIVRDSIDREEAVKGAPEVQEGQFRVPKIV